MIGADVRREAERNRLLRRADWRFLLPDPRPATSMCFAGGLLARSVALISGRLVGAPCGDCDLTVAANPDRASLRVAWAALRPGGACYTEWSSPLAGGPAGIRRRLEAAGFERITCYTPWCWPWPSLSYVRCWLPLDAPGARRYFLVDHPAASGAVLRIGRALRRVAWMLSLRLPITLPLLPICAVARKPAMPACARPKQEPHSRVAEVSEISADLAEMIRAGWSAWGFGPAPGHLSWLVLAGGDRSINKVVGLVFAEPSPRPRIAVKLPRVPESAPALLREAAALQAVQALRSGGVAGVPRVLFCQERDGFVALAETAVTGTTLFTQLRHDTYRDLALAATAWLVDLAGQPEPCPRASWWNRLIEPVLAEFGASFGAVVDPGMLRETRDILASVDALPLVCEQRDFSPWNVLVTDGGQLAVLDWESAELRGLPALDLMYFLTYLAFFLDGSIASGRFRSSYRAMLDPATLTGSVLSECLVRYAGQIGLDPSALRPLRLLVWLLHSHSEYQRLVADAAGRPDRGALRRSLFVSLWEEELWHATTV